MLSIDTETGVIATGHDIDQELINLYPCRTWLEEKSRTLATKNQVERLDQADLMRSMKQHLLTQDEINMVLKPLARDAQEATGAMGDDTPMAVLSQKNRPLYDYFRQRFAQVTNPPIDSLREAVVMSLETPLAQAQNIFAPSANDAQVTILEDPMLCSYQFAKLQEDDEHITINLNYDPKKYSLQQYLDIITEQAQQAASDGRRSIILTDADCLSDHVPVHALLAVGAVHHHLINVAMRCSTNIIVATATARDAHHFACLLGCGATAIYPYLVHALIADMGDSFSIANYRKGINKGLLKILSKMGISTLCSYRGAQLFEAIGLSAEVVNKCFTGIVSRISGATFEDLEKDMKQLQVIAADASASLSFAGVMKYVHGQEYHAYNPDVVKHLHQAVRTGEYKAYQNYADAVDQREVMALRDLMQLDLSSSIPIEEVESAESILKRFDSAGMSLGALSPEAHETLAEAMNSLGGRSNSGEGGENPDRYGTIKNSKIKQIASGRFGVTPHYLVNAEVLQIKIAQGAKPGEGGQLPGGKVTAHIAELRYSLPGVTLISPPPHHDIYSIEDLAQLIFDLKQVNPKALVSVKLVASPGVGTIASGVAKAYADFITISGYDGGTAASPLSSIRYAGSPWELGLSEVQQSLRIHGLRDRVRIQTDGGLKTGLDVIKAAILGAESFGFGTAPMVAMGCKYLRICHLNNCATGIATQHEVLRDQHYHGTVDMVRNFFTFVAQDTRQWLAKLGVSSLQELIGRVDLISLSSGSTDKHKHLNLEPLLYQPETDHPMYCKVPNTPFDQALLAEQMVKESIEAIKSKSGGSYKFDINNCDRSIGARVSGEIAKIWGNHDMQDAPITISCKGVAGQSFGAWNAGGLHLYLEGDANDYVGKGMTDGKIVIVPSQECTFKTQETVIAGNTCLYGATGGKLFVSGIAGERFAVRNSGAYAVVEGAGDHCCEYMTGGSVVVLNSVGKNFGAGMTGGKAYVVDIQGTLKTHINPETIKLHKIKDSQPHQNFFTEALNSFSQETKSSWGAEIQNSIENYLDNTWIILPKEQELEAAI